ncbi:uncharacterized protein LOC121728543 isoform X1 [Aricia agestis]|uniref:uncharacterized protein LOC121728543 isoform X1 n=1 Tax=Aricia agestis TaxID=91739 RepID=UPI001C205FD4|nr:uncharacterized protein LOC121728543 isoform X1 [Aricia agestis]XP_041972747.1 uncharacterized protein LOC121728543 isoform X1 [Aricia agestis]
MKLIVTLLLLSAAVVSFAAVAKAPAARANLSIGSIGPRDRLLHRGYLYRQGVPNSIQYQDYMYRGNATNRISAIRAFEVGYTQYASPWLIQGGLGYNYATIRVQSARGWGYYYSIEIYGQ